MNSALIAPEPPASALLSASVSSVSWPVTSPEPAAPVERPAKLAMLWAPLRPETGEMKASRSESTIDCSVWLPNIAPFRMSESVCGLMTFFSLSSVRRGLDHVVVRGDERLEPAS